MISAVLFDFGQTLADASEAFRVAEREAQRRLMDDLAPESEEEFVKVYRQVRTEFHARSDFSRRATWEEVYRRCGKTPAAERLEAWEELYWERIEAETVLFPEVPEVLGRLQERYLLGLITNTQGQKDYGKHRMSRFPELEGYFKATVVAGASGVPAKPDPVPFRICLEQLGIQPADAVFVGDDWRIDIRGAKDVGIQPVWLKHRSFRRTWPEPEFPVPTIDCLDGLLDLEKLLSRG